ncbi:Radical SAM domain protein [Paramagnetospirillum magnetotacticum MS-1]|uniref:Radical SAM domain protein n=1 Tax=Paramagnetospirillum magnetotacticum MS-1 TaxID=272627 RepID=A0A0C2UY36_PARME|nr:radical SAM protein [Paramagnetospirillum magnetotacticum]KIL97721.1 Radical SAM domain protein [Paramagnetospirillum magnetotacticum MS-1]
MPFYVLPISLAYLAANLSERHTVKVVDCSADQIPEDSEEFRQIIRDFAPDMVGSSATYVTYNYAVMALKTAKAVSPDIITIMGGAHPSIYPDRIITTDREIDYLMCGEAERSFPRFVDALADGTGFEDVAGLVYRRGDDIVKNPLDLNAELDTLRRPDYDVMGLEKYIAHDYSYGGLYGRSAPIWFTRGCPFACTFCSAYLITGKKVRHHSMDYMVEWIDHLYHQYGIRQFAFIDDGLTVFPDIPKQFCRTIIDLRRKGHWAEPIYFTSPNGTRMEKLDDELLRLMKEAGWQGLTIAPESGSRRVLKQIKKSLDPDIVPDVVRRIKAAGLGVRGFFIFGFPGETREDIDETIGLIRRCDFDTFNIGRFLPIPGTPIFNQMVADGEISADHIPGQVFEYVTASEAGLGTYTPATLKDVNLNLLALREQIYLYLRKPSSIVYFARYYGIGRVLSYILFMVRKRFKAA